MAWMARSLPVAGRNRHLNSEPPRSGLSSPEEVSGLGSDLTMPRAGLSVWLINPECSPGDGKRGNRPTGVTSGRYPGCPATTSAPGPIIRRRFQRPRGDPGRVSE